MVRGPCVCLSFVLYFGVCNLWSGWFVSCCVGASCLRVDDPRYLSAKSHRRGNDFDSTINFFNLSTSGPNNTHFGGVNTHFEKDPQKMEYTHNSGVELKSWCRSKIRYSISKTHRMPKVAGHVSQKEPLIIGFFC